MNHFTLVCFCEIWMPCNTLNRCFVFLTGRLSYCKITVSLMWTCYFSVCPRSAAGNVCFMFHMLVRVLFTQWNLDEENHTYTVNHCSLLLTHMLNRFKPGNTSSPKPWSRDIHCVCMCLKQLYRDSQRTSCQSTQHFHKMNIAND